MEARGSEFAILDPLFSMLKITVDTYGHLVPGGNRQAIDDLDERVTSRENAEAATGCHGQVGTGNGHNW